VSGTLAELRKLLPPAKVEYVERQLTPIVNTIRALLEQQPVGGEIWIALAWCFGILIVAYAFAMVAYRRRIA
jgi:ABC-2 type transport system permease protein